MVQNLPLRVFCAGVVVLFSTSNAIILVTLGAGASLVLLFDVVLTLGVGVVSITLGDGSLGGLVSRGDDRLTGGGGVGVDCALTNGSFVSVATPCVICCRRLRSSYVCWFSPWALTLFVMVVARLLAAATIASAGVTFGLVRYLCLKNIVPKILVIPSIIDNVLVMFL